MDLHSTQPVTSWTRPNASVALLYRASAWRRSVRRITYHRLYMPDVIEQQVFPLDRALFPIGKEYGQPGAVVQHNNWVFGAEEKRQRQRDHGLYLFNHTSTNRSVAGWLATQQAQGVNVTGLRYAVGAKEAAAAVDITTSSPRPDWGTHGELLQCDVCVACANMPAAVAPLRTSWPGKSVRQQYKEGDGYRGPSTSHP